MIDPSALVFPTWAFKSSYSAQSFPENLIYIPSDREKDRGTRFPALLLNCPQPTRHLILYFHANAEDLGTVFPFLKDMQALLCCHVMAIEYPGYGICPGRPTPDRILQQGHSTMKFIRDVLRFPLDSVILLGRSVGTAPCVKMAAAWPVHGQCLLAPFSSVREVGRERFGRWTENLVSSNYLNSERTMANVRVPTLIIHGKSDLTIPPDHGRRLFEACRAKNFLFVSPLRLDHNMNVLSDPAFFFNPMVKFFSSLPGRRSSSSALDLAFVPRHFFSPSPPEEGDPLAAVCQVGGETLSALLAVETLTEAGTGSSTTDSGSYRVALPATGRQPLSGTLESESQDSARVPGPERETPPSRERKKEKEKRGFWGMVAAFVQRGIRFVFGLGI
uniref:Peptidase S9 prolyl oligopeptidase catalytic domain-containing protein n=1 Tax=Chromera velia CCMP2878 TaxID=1169474 RepID=A0A0G4HML8_9ALVE|eukprot:Cvel_7517.t1-p1 / transcript=Cvel_7517.t1 / gene=Cvel_7517 / organism=Chromera_velia_CCMP2878 / gene_product=Alpha/beta hydrolase domain-containing protein 17A, putative / transcript_product=Alpha/beta hydrolase domain-containing protein 17A, putative / location=Cvel_scaffold395:15849-18203(-) / protein_length=388 / sequence_SO=supercontig / SO=protein_coding / is_pseudo=false